MIFMNVSLFQEVQLTNVENVFTSICTIVNMAKITKLVTFILRLAILTTLLQGDIYCDVLRLALLCFFIDIVVCL